MAYDLVRDEMCLFNSEEAVGVYSKLKKLNPDGMLEQIFNPVVFEDDLKEEHFDS